MYYGKFENREWRVSYQLSALRIIMLSYLMGDFKHIILVDILLIARIFPRPCRAWKNTTQLAKYPRVLYVKRLNKMYLLLDFISVHCSQLAPQR